MTATPCSASRATAPANRTSFDHGAEPRRVAIVQGQLGMGGSERQIALFLRECDRRVWAPHVYVASHKGRGAEQLIAAGIPVTLLKGNPARKMWQFRRAVARQGAQAFVSWSSWTNIFSWVLIGLRIPSMGSFRNAGFADLPSRFRPLWVWASRTHLSMIVCNSQETAQELRRSSRRSRRVIFVPNAVEPVADISTARPAWRREFGVTDDEVLVMGIGRLTPQKAFDRFVEAVALCHARHPIRAVILGPDFEDQATALLGRIEATGLPDGVLRYLGPHDMARKAVCAADVFLLTSRHEGMPNVVLEAMAAGVPCVSTQVNGISSLLTSEVDGLITGHDTLSVADALLRLVEDPVTRQMMGRRARQRLDAHAPSAVYQPLWAALEAEIDRTGPADPGSLRSNLAVLVHTTFALISRSARTHAPRPRRE